MVCGSPFLRVDDNVNTTIMDITKKKFGKLLRTTGKKHTYFVINIEFLGRKIFEITSTQHIDDAIEDFKEEVNINVVEPNKHNLLILHIKSQPRDHRNMGRFQSIKAKLLWIMKISIPDIDTSVSFLCTRVQ